MKAALVLALFAVPGFVSAQARPATCEVRPLWVVKGGPRSADLGVIGTFEADGKEGIAIRSFKLPNSGLVVTAGINYEFDYSHKPEPAPFRISMAITVSDREQSEIFESVDSSEASTRYDKHWNLRVTRNIPFDNRTYMFTLNCWDSKKK